MAKKARSIAEKLREENGQLREAARQLLAGLTEYAKPENWNPPTINDSSWEWKGEGEGPAIARKFLGLDQDKN